MELEPGDAALSAMVRFLVDYVASNEDRESEPAAGEGLCFATPCLYMACTPCELALRFAQAAELAGAGAVCQREYRVPHLMLSARQESMYGPQAVELRVRIQLSAPVRHERPLLMRVTVYRMIST